MSQVEFHSGAVDELTEAALFYAHARPSLGEAFVAAVHGTLVWLAVNPRLGGRLAGSDIRRLQVRRFPYSVYYRILPDRIRVLALAHHSRRPSYWSGRS